MSKLQKTDAEWRRLLSSDEYRITRQKGTERAFTGEYWQTTGKPGVYLCKCCGEALFDAATKYDSGSGWPSFYEPVAASQVTEVPDESHGMRRVEVRSKHGDSHLGHVFTDGPSDSTGLRYCINSASLRFIAREDMEAEGYGDLLPIFSVGRKTED